jgi:hypothetical protein
VLNVLSPDEPLHVGSLQKPHCAKSKNSQVKPR